MKLLAITVLLFSLCIGSSFAQEKFEKEYRMEVANVPLPARQFVDSLNFKRRVRWYKEISQQGESIEAKSKRDGQKYSVEFGLLGDLQDVEIEIRWRDLPEPLRKTIDQSLDGEFERFKIRKLQRQFTGEGGDVLKHIIHPVKVSDAVTTRYEIVLKGRKDSETNEFEYTYLADGRLEKRAKMTFRNTDNLEY